MLERESGTNCTQIIKITIELKLTERDSALTSKTFSASLILFFLLPSKAPKDALPVGRPANRVRARNVGRDRAPRHRRQRLAVDPNGPRGGEACLVNDAAIGQIDLPIVDALRANEAIRAGIKGIESLAVSIRIATCR